jgi:hypothetical protein
MSSASVRNQTGRTVKMVSRTARAATELLLFAMSPRSSSACASCRALGRPDHAGVRHDEGPGRADVALLVPRPRLHLGDAGVVVAAQLADAVVEVAPAAGELAGEVDGRALDLPAGARQGEERPDGERLLAARLAHGVDRPGGVARELLRDLDGGGDFRDGAGLLDGGRLGGGGLDGARLRQPLDVGGHARASASE